MGSRGFSVLCFANRQRLLQGNDFFLAKQYQVRVGQRDPLVCVLRLHPHAPTLCDIAGGNEALPSLVGPRCYRPCRRFVPLQPWNLFLPARTNPVPAVLVFVLVFVFL